MTKTTNECVGCVSVGLPCLGVGCPKRNVTRHFCDKCGAKTNLDELTETENGELCRACMEEAYGDGECD